MEIWMIAGILFVIALVLFVYSLIKKEDKDLTYKELEEFSITVTHTVYNLNERVAELENELKVVAKQPELSNQVTTLAKDNIVTLFQKGLKTETISRQLGIAETSVQHTIDTYISEGI